MHGLRTNLEQIVICMQMEPATPYFSISDRLMKPLRPREVICELLACGLPISSTAHTTLNNVQDCKAFVRASKRLVAAARPRGVGLISHVTVAVERGLISAACIAYVNDIRDAVRAVNVALAAGIFNSVVCFSTVLFDFCALKI